MNDAVTEHSDTIAPTSKQGGDRARHDDFASQHTAEKAGALVMQARRAERKGQLGEAKQLLQQALTLAPSDIGALELLGDVFLAEAEQEKAKKVFEHGLKFHPRHRAFEEKIALCILDLEEMRRQRERSQSLLDEGDTESWMNLKPQRALSLSLLLPGAGHVYAEQNDHAAWIFGAYVLVSLGWMLPLHFGLENARSQGIKGIGRALSHAMGNMNALGQLWFWLMIVAGIAIYLYAIVDAMAAVERANEKRKHGHEETTF